MFPKILQISGNILFSNGILAMYIVVKSNIQIMLFDIGTQPFGYVIPTKIRPKIMIKRYIRWQSLLANNLHHIVKRASNQPVSRIFGWKSFVIDEEFVCHVSFLQPHCSYTIIQVSYNVNRFFQKKV